MALPLNPMLLNGPNASAPYVQPNTANPPANAAIASAAVGVDELALNYTTPPAKYRQPGIGGFPF